MKVKTIVTGNDLTEGIGFYGDTRHDNESMKRLKELAMLLEDVVFDLVYVERQVKGKHKGSAKEIKRQLDTMRKDLLWIAFGEEVAKDIIKLLEEQNKWDACNCEFRKKTIEEKQ